MKASIYMIIGLLLVSLVAAAPLSIIDSKYVTFDSGLSGPAWVIDVRGDNDASYIVFGDNTEITDTVEGTKATATEDFVLNQNIDSESCEYALQETSRNDVWQYKIDLLASNRAVWVVDDYIKECYDSGGVLAWGEYPVFGILQDVYCLRETKVANVGEVLTGRINFKSTFTLQKGQQTPITKQVTTIAENADEIPTSISFSDGSKTVARIRWIGGSTYGEVCPIPDNFVSVQYGNKWYTADRDNYILYNDQYVELKELITKVVTTKSITRDETADVRRLVLAANERGSAALTERKISLTGTNAITTGAVSVLQLPRDHLIYLPDFQIVLHADWLGVTFQTSKPKIIDAKFNSCSEDVESSLYATIQNIGQSDGLFLISVSCQEGLKPTSTTSTIRLKAGETGTATLPFMVDLATDATKSCTINVVDSLKSEMKDSKSISASCQASVFCQTEGQRNCFGTVEKICQSGQWIDTSTDACSEEVCDRDGTCDYKVGESFELCGGKLASDNDCATCNLNDRCEATETQYSCSHDCGEIKKEIPLWMYITGGIALAAIVFFGSTMIKPGKGKKKTKGRFKWL